MKKRTYISDAELVEAYQAGKANALSILVKRWHISFCNLAYWYVKDADVAKDIAQESWTIIMRKIKDLQEPTKFKSWSISIVNRRAIDWLRAQQSEHRKLYKFYDEAPSRNIAVNDSDRQELKSKLLTAILDLPEDQQTVIRLFYTQNYSLKEISELLSISVGTAKSRLFHAREKLKLIIKK